MNPNTTQNLMALGLSIMGNNRNEPLVILNVIEQNSGVEKVKNSRKLISSAEKLASSTEQKVEAVLRYDYNILTGILHTVREKNITSIILGLHEKSGLIDSFLGTLIEKLLKGTEKMLLIYKYTQPLNTLNRILVLVPDRAEYEIGFTRWVHTLLQLKKQLSSKLFFYGSGNTLAYLKPMLGNNHKSDQIEVHLYSILADPSNFSDWIKDNDLVVVVSARQGSLSYQNSFVRLPYNFSRVKPETSLLILYPEQFNRQEEEDFGYLERTIV